MNDDLRLTYTPRPGHNDVAYSKRLQCWIGFVSGAPIWETMSDGPTAEDAAETRRRLNEYVAKRTKKAA